MYAANFLVKITLDITMMINIMSTQTIILKVLALLWAAIGVNLPKIFHVIIKIDKAINPNIINSNGLVKFLDFS